MLLQPYNRNFIFGKNFYFYFFIQTFFFFCFLFGHCLFVSHYYYDYYYTLAFTLDTDIISTHKFVNKECNRVMQFPKRNTHKFFSHHLLYRWDESEKKNKHDWCHSVQFTLNNDELSFLLLLLFFLICRRWRFFYTRKKKMLILIIMVRFLIIFIILRKIMRAIY